MINQVLDVLGLKDDESRSEQRQQDEVEKAYDDFQRPPSLEIAQKHASATKFAMTDQNIDLDKTNVCPCCGLPTVIQELPLCSSRRDFSFNGSGIALYFDFLVFSCIILAQYLLIAGIYILYDNPRGNRCISEVNSKFLCQDTLYNQYSRTNVVKEIDEIGSILNCIACVIIQITTLYYRNHINKISQELDDAAILASDYSIFVENIPKNFKEREIREYFSQNFQGQQVEIKKICLAYEISKYLELEKQKLEKEQLLTKVLRLERAGKAIPPKMNKEKLMETIKSINAEQDFLEDNLETSFQFSGVAIISYNREKQADYVCEEHQASRFDLLMEAVFGMKFSYKRFDRNMIVVRKAPEPGDIIWGNLGIDVKSQAKRILITNMMTVLVLILAFSIIFGLSFAQAAISRSMDEDSITAQILITFLGLIASILISALNLFISRIITYFAQLEQHSITTEQDISVAKKMGIAQFLNTALITLIANFVIKDSDEPILTTIWKPGGLNTDVFLIFITNSILPWAMQLLDPHYLYKWYVRQQIIKEGERSLYSQKEANLAFEGPKIDLSKKYAILAKTLMMTFFYAYLLPLGVLLTMGSLVFIYWTEKYLLLKRDAKPPPTGSAMAEAMVAFYIELILIVYSVGCVVWEFIIFKELHWLTWVQFGLSILYYFLPEEQVCACIVQTGRDNATVESYEEKYLTFYDDYDRRNPITLDRAKAAWIKLQQDTVTVQTPLQPKSSTIQLQPQQLSMRSASELQLKKPISQVTTGKPSQFSRIHPESPEHERKNLRVID